MKKFCPFRVGKGRLSHPCFYVDTLFSQFSKVSFHEKSLNFVFDKTKLKLEIMDKN